MTTTTAPLETRYPDVAPPTGADLIDDWNVGHGETYRVIFGVDRAITDTALRAYSTVVQLADGSIDQGGTVEEPSVNVSDNECDTLHLNVDQARELAAALLSAAAEIDGWSAR